MVLRIYDSDSSCWNKGDFGTNSDQNFDRRGGDKKWTLTCPLAMDVSFRVEDLATHHPKEGLSTARPPLEPSKSRNSIKKSLFSLKYQCAEICLFSRNNWCVLRWVKLRSPKQCLMTFTMFNRMQTIRTKYEVDQLSAPNGSIANWSKNGSSAGHDLPNMLLRLEIILEYPSLFQTATDLSFTNTIIA